MIGDGKEQKLSLITYHLSPITLFQRPSFSHSCQALKLKGRLRKVSTSLPAGREPPAWYAEKQAELFRHVEGPVAALRPGLDAAGVACLARTLFSAVHGVVSLGLDEKLAPMPETALRRELRLVAEAMARGLDARGP